MMKVFQFMNFSEDYENEKTASQCNVSRINIVTNNPENLPKITENLPEITERSNESKLLKEVMNQ